VRQRVILVVAFVLLLSLVQFPSIAQAQAHTFTVTGANPTGCSISSNPEIFSFTIDYSWPGAPLVLEATVIDAGSTGLSGTSSTNLPAGSGLGANPAFQFPTAATLPVPYPWAFTVRVVGLLNGVPTWTADVLISCPGSGGPYAATQLSNGPVTPSVVAGCDALLPIPATAVGGTFVADAPVYWAPGKLTSPLVTIRAGNTARVIGQDDTGQFYKIIWVCDFVWVPTATMGPNYDNVWHGAPLPTGVVK